MEELEFGRPEIDALFDEFKYRTPRQQILLETFVAVALNSINRHGSANAEQEEQVSTPDPNARGAGDQTVRIVVPDENVRLTIRQQFDRAFTPGWPKGQPEARMGKVGTNLQVTVDTPTDQ
jgi:hypothetical protein